MFTPRKITKPDAEMDALWRQLNSYAVRYHLSGPDRERLVEHTFVELTNEPDSLIEKPVEQAIAETMYRVFMSGKST
ncbi:hypothetical protein [Endobacterium cereale]|uniref:hypothetical protein n=1 Tax=Endobacterium cereale TaxID=2663029 RepID=UPI002B481B88|nr:hypothetical protein [Endobacterium cereale]MEB2848541.1 hypothetical protein [Endobacterium cereale]